MNSQTIIFIVISGIIALLLALFQYIYKSKKSKVKLWLAVLRFVSIFAILLLLVNPKFEAVSYYEEKPNLVIALDNSESVAYLKQDEKAKTAFQNLISSTELQNKFNIKTFKFGENVLLSIDSFYFNERQTNISGFFKNYNELYKNTISPVILISDGNQTIGNDYKYIVKKNQPVYPIILGDTSTFSDLRIGQVNVNRYAYLKNKFPVEIITNYSGIEPTTGSLNIRLGNSIVFAKKIEFNANKTSEIVKANLNASNIGIKNYKVEIAPLENEKNKVNNYKNFAIEIIDQKTNIALVTENLHPDLGVLKKAIESNEQRSVSILKPKEFISQSIDFNLVILFSPNNRFNSVYKRILNQKLNTFTIAGSSTDWNFVNDSQSLFKQEVTNQSEDYQPELNPNFGVFIVDNITFIDYPPLESDFGNTTFLVPQETILYKTINGINTEESLLSTFEINNQKHALLNGEGIWRWRAQCYLNTDSFEGFDNFIGKFVQYLSSNKKRQRLSLDYKSFYNQNENIIVNAQFFNKNYEFDTNSNLQITYVNEETNVSKTLPLLLNNTSYRIDLSGIEPGDYNFSIKSNDEPISSSGNFTILAYNVEQQFLNADVTKLQSVATSTNAKSYFIDEYNTIISELVSDERYATIQKSKRNRIPIIDWKYLLSLIALALSLEWCIRKYNGLI
ncbi:VWA domain-containing protein [Winogradskyella sp.]|uniref:VWA domain-containing protein n=1 Tax=Winogradskyella sp. TaxID=1883156 RepID=UPI0035C823BC